MNNSGSAPTLLNPERRTTRRSGPPAPETTAETGLPPRIGRYALVRPLGEGGMGVVYIAFDEWLDRKVAIKLLRQRGGGAAAHVRMLREAQALARLAHPNVVAIHDVGEVDGQVYIAMEFVTGVTLRTWLKEQARTQAEILAVFTEIGRGLAAAHAAGLIHRDIKPDNVMIGADGRARVMDFGLARTPHGSDDPAPDRSDTASMLATEVTVAGAIVGTPAYMAPEQLLGGTADARSDLYGFCVALYEALYRERPFPDQDDADSPRAALQREVLPTKVAAHVPAWLRAVVLRGLAFAPAQRWSSLPELLAALARDPIAARRRALRTLAGIAAVAALAAAVSLAIVHLQRAWARERGELLAAERLAAVDEAAGRALAAGRPAEAEAMFHAFVADPEHRGTSALARAWLRRGDQQQRAAAPDEALAAYARAYVEAREPADVVAGLQAMAGVFRDEWNGPALLQTVAAVRARGVDDDATARLAAFADLRVRDLAGAATELARVDRTGAAELLRTLSGARATTVRAEGITDLGPGHDARFLAVAQGNQRVDLLDADLAPVRSWSADGDFIHLVPGTSWVITRRKQHEALFDMLAPDAPLWRTEAEVGMFRMRGVDLDGDGARELLLTRAAPRRGFRVVTGIAAGEPREQAAELATEQSQSDIDAIVEADLDDDGRLEIVVAAGAWQAYDVRVFTVDDAGRLTLAARRRLGRVGALTVAGPPGARRIFAIKDDHYPSPRVFPEPPHTGPLAGVHRLRWTGAEIVDDGFVALPRRGPVARFNAAGSIHAGDLDGDGVDEVVAKLDGERGDLMIVRQLPDGRLDLLTIANLWPLRIAQLDADPALELLVSDIGRGPLWALGAGDEALPTLRPAPHDPRPPPPALTDPLLALRWTRADELAAIGLPAGAAASLHDAANLTADPRARADLLDRAAALHVSAGDDAAALAIDRELAATGTPSVDALARDGGALARLGRYDEAYARAGELLAHPAGSPEQRAEAVARRTRLAPLVGAATEIDLADPLAPAWQVLRPAALRRDPGAGALALAVLAGDVPAARLPLQWSGGPLHLDVEFTIDRLEFGSCMRISVLDDEGRNWLGGGLCGLGGGGRLSAALHCQSPGLTTMYETHDALAPGTRVRVRLAWFLDESFECTFDGVGEGPTVRRRLPPTAGPPAGRYWLAIGAIQSHERANLAIGALHRVELRGAQVVDDPVDDPLLRAASHLVDGDPQAALVDLAAAPADDPRRPLWQALAHDLLNDLAGVTAAIAEVPLDMSERPLSDELHLALRTRPAVAAALRQRLGPAALPLLDSVYSSLGYHHRGDPTVRGLVLAAMAGVEALTATRDPERTAQRRLLATRATLWDHLGDASRARLDREAALAVVDVDSEEDATLRAELRTALAIQSATEDPDAALAHARAALAVAPAPELVRMRLGDDPNLALLAADPAWHVVLRRPADP